MVDDARKTLRFLNAGGHFHPDKPGAGEWVARLVGQEFRRPDVALIQEVPGEAWLTAWTDAGYRVILVHSRGWKVRSAVLTLMTEDDCVGLGVGEIPELAYHGDYVAAARLIGWGRDRGDLTLLSVHASPSVATAEYLVHHPYAAELRARDGGDDRRYRGSLWDADVVLETIARQAPNVLAAGDLNEARGWDDTHPGHTWGAEYFGRPDGSGQLVGGAVQARSLLDVPLAAGTDEIVTRRAPGHPPLQLDHILTTNALAARVHDVEVDTAWTNSTDAAAGLADHAPIRFSLSSALTART